MQICICIPTFNQSAFLGRAVECCLAQTGVEVRVIVSDDASTDDTATVMRRFANDPRVVYHRKPENRGIAANAGWVIAQAGTEFFVRLDSDDLLACDFCETLVACLQANPQAAVAHAAVREIDQHGAYKRIRRLHRSSGYQEPDAALRDAVSGYRVAANICMFRRSALLGKMIYREGMNFAEDWDLWVRLADGGWGNVYVDQVLAEYRVWSDSGGYRQGRKFSELCGIGRVYSDSLSPAFERRGWDARVLKSACRQIASGQVRALRRVPRSSADHSKIVQELKHLGDGWSLRWRLLLVQVRGGWLLDWMAGWRLKARDWIKRLLANRVGRKSP